MNGALSAMPPRLIIGNGVVIEGYHAAVLAPVLRSLARAGQFDHIAPAARTELLALIGAIEHIAGLWRVDRARLASDRGTAEVEAAAVAASLDSKEIVTVREAAEMLDLSERRVRQLAARGLGTKHNDTWMLERAAVLALLEQRNEDAA